MNFKDALKHNSRQSLVQTPPSIDLASQRIDKYLESFGYSSFTSIKLKEVDRLFVEFVDLYKLGEIDLKLLAHISEGFLEIGIDNILNKTTHGSLIVHLADSMELIDRDPGLREYLDKELIIISALDAD